MSAGTAAAADVRVEVRDLYGRWSMALDTRRPELMFDDLTDDALLWVSDRGHYAGRAEIQEIARGRAGRNRHVITNIVVEPIDDDGALAHAYFHLVDLSTGDILAHGTYDDLVVRERDRWRWSRKAVTFLYRTPEYAANVDAIRLPNHGELDNPVGGFGTSGAPTDGSTSR